MGTDNLGEWEWQWTYTDIREICFELQKMFRLFGLTLSLSMCTLRIVYTQFLRMS